MNDLYKEHYLLRAIELAENNAKNGTGGPFAALVVKDDVIIAEAVNTVTPDKDPTAHAEVNAIRIACQKLNTFRLDGCQIYASCEPCPMCLGAIFWAHPDVVFYAATQQQASQSGFDDSFIYEQIALPNDQRKIAFIHKIVAISETPFQQWSSNDQKVTY
ncbi:MAG: nucleoside deaminase [Bacteroidales bacterium]|nr:nucleoside deaminase [Bacteroidales bacterium]